MSDKIESINMSVAVFSANLVTVKDVEEFVRVASSCPKGTDISVQHGKFITDGKSLMGILSLNLSEPSLNLSEPVEVEIKSDKSSEVMSKILSQFDKWRVED